METVIVGSLLAAFVALVGWLLRRSVSDIDRRVRDLEENDQATSLKLADQQARVEMLGQSDSDLKNEIKYIRDNMVRREDLSALSQRIDDALQKRRR